MAALHLLPRQTAPALIADTLSGPWSLAQAKPEAFTLIVMYRGLHCPLCRDQLQELHNVLGDFRALGVDAIALSSDTKEKAIMAQQDWHLPDLQIGYDLAFHYAQPWRLFISNARKAGEPAQFYEPGTFLVGADGDVYFAQIQSMPFGRPSLSDMPRWLKHCIENAVPARGEADTLVF